MGAGLCSAAHVRSAAHQKERHDQADAHDHHFDLKRHARVAAAEAHPCRFVAKSLSDDLVTAGRESAQVGSAPVHDDTQSSGFVHALPPQECGTSPSLPSALRIGGVVRQSADDSYLIPLSGRP